MMENRKSLDILSDYLDAREKHVDRDGNTYWKSRMDEFAEEFDKHISTVVMAEVLKTLAGVEPSDDF